MLRDARLHLLLVAAILPCYCRRAIAALDSLVLLLARTFP